MKTLNFTKEIALGIGDGEFNRSDALYNEFIVSNLDLRIKEVTPFFSYSIMDSDSNVGELVISGNGYFTLGSIYEGKILDSPVKNLAGSSSTSIACFLLNQRNIVDLRVFAGDSLSIYLPFFITGKGAIDNVFQLKVIAGVNILYEEVEHEAFR